jgi:hypothetical protein
MDKKESHFANLLGWQISAKLDKTQFRRVFLKHVGQMIKFLIYRYGSNGVNRTDHRVFLKGYDKDSNLHKWGTKTQALKSNAFNSYKECRIVLNNLSSVSPAGKYYFVKVVVIKQE